MDSIPRVEGRLKMQHLALLAFDKERCKPFFDRLTELFHEHHHSSEQNPERYEELLYRIHRPYTNDMLDMVDDWMGVGKREWREETTREVKLAMYAIRYPDTLLIDSLQKVLDQISVDSQHTYTSPIIPTQFGMKIRAKA